jgi:hypothetical protein
MHTKLPLCIQVYKKAGWSKERCATTATSAVHTTALVLLLVAPRGFMNRPARTKKLTLYRERLRRLTRELGPHDLGRALGGSDSDYGGGMHVPIVTESLHGQGDP